MLTEGWKTEQEDKNGVLFSNNEDGVDIWVVAKVGTQAVNLDELVQDLLDSSKDEFIGTPQITYDQVAVGDEAHAPQATLLVKNKKGYYGTIRLIAVWKASYNYVFTIIGSKIAVQTDRLVLKKILDSVRFSTPRVSDLDRSKTLVLLGGGNPKAEDLDPARTQSGAHGYTGLLFSGLVRLSAQLQVEPDLAESWIVSDEGNVYTFTLRSSVTFQSGKTLTAKDVKYSWERAVDPKTGSTTAATYLGDIVGVSDRIAGKASEISGVKVLDERRLQVTLDGPKPYFLDKLTYPTSFIVDEENVSKNTQNWMFSPNGSGPFKLDHFEKDSEIVFKRFDGFHAPAKVENIAYMLSLGGPRLDYFQTDEVDVAPLGVTEAKAVLNPSHPLHSQLQSATSMCTEFIQMNNNVPPMDDANVRRAFALAIDKDRLIDLLSSKLELRADTILPPAMPGFSSTHSGNSFDVQAAREALKASKYAGNLPKIVINFSGYSGVDDPFMNALLDMWQTNLGVKVEVEYLDPTNFTKAIREHHGQMADFGWCADYPDPENFLDILYHTGSDYNLVGYSNPQVDAVLEKARIEPDTTQRLAQYQQAEDMLLNDYAAIPLWHDVFYMLVKPRVQGFIVTPLGTMRLDQVSVQNP
jgi:oligopeptide transport system substrate-binding protein